MSRMITEEPAHETARNLSAGPVWFSPDAAAPTAPCGGATIPDELLPQLWSADGVDSIIAGLSAIIGVALGSVLTYLFPVRTARQTQEFARDQQFWRERLAAYSEFAGIVTDFRRSEYDRWHREQEDPHGAPFISARDESYQLRGKATAAMCRIQLVGGDTTLSQLAERALDATTEVHTATDEDDRARRGEKARLALQDFLKAATGHVR